MTGAPQRIAATMATFLLLATACGDSGTTTTAPPGTEAPATTVAAPATTTAPTTTAAATTTIAPTTIAAPATTVAPTTTVAATTTAAAVSGDPQAIADAKAAAVLAAAPADWTANQLDDPTAGGDDTDIIFGPCAADDAFDLNDLDDQSAAIEQVEVVAPAGSGGGLFPDPEVQVEARVFVSEDVAAEAFAVLETVLGTADGRDCLSANLFDEFADELPAGAEVEFSVDELAVAGADVGVRITMDLSVSGITAAIFIDIYAARDGACTVYGSNQSFDTPVDPAVQEGLFGAALDA